MKTIAHLAIILSCLFGLHLSSAKGQVNPKKLPLDYIEFSTGKAPVGDRVSVIALHGLGDSPNNFSLGLRRSRLPIHWIIPQAPKAYGRGFSWFDIRPSFRRDPEQTGPGLNRATSTIADFIQHLRRTKAIRGKPIVIGFSQGGMLSYSLAATHQSLLRGVIPISGFLPLTLSLPTAINIPIVALHGKIDRVVPYRLAVTTAALFSTSAPRFNLYGFDGVGHRITTEMWQLIDESLLHMLTL